MKLTEKQKNCLFCHKANGFTKKSSPYQSFFSRAWEEGFKQILRDTKVENPKNIVHGVPFRYSMMVWSREFQDESLIIYDLRTGKGEEVTVTPGFLAPFYCPVCGRPIGRRGKRC